MVIFTSAIKLVIVTEAPPMLFFLCEIPPEKQQVFY